MRETKFRGKRLDTGEWVYGSLVIYRHNGVSPDIYDPETSQYLAVDPATVGEYTGLKDKNGVEIYEGDVVVTNHPYLENAPGVVEFYEGSFYRSIPAFTIHPTGAPNMHFESIRDYYKPEVIGNASENPELLERAS